MAHSHAHHQSGADGGGWRIAVALLLNVGIVVAQVMGGVLSGSLALLADAAHNGSDAASLGISYVARRIAGRAPDRRRTFGYARVETVAALINLTTLVVIGLYLLAEGVGKLFSPDEVDGKTMLIVSAIAFVEDLLSVVVLYPLSKGSLNVRSATLHLVVDTLSTVAVLAGAAAVIWFDFYLIDPLLTILISLFILYHGAKELRSAASVLIDSAPKGFDFDGAIAAVSAVPGVRDVHHVHVWQLDEQRVAMEAHLILDKSDLNEVERVKADVKSLLRERFGVDHSTLEVEVDACAPHDRSVIPEHEAGEAGHHDH